VAGLLITNSRHNVLVFEAQEHCTTSTPNQLDNCSTGKQLKNYGEMGEFTANGVLNLGLQMINRGIKSIPVAKERFQAN
jgi:hypothetical protein